MIQDDRRSRPARLCSVCVDAAESVGLLPPCIETYGPGPAAECDACGVAANVRRLRVGGQEFHQDEALLLVRAVRKVLASRTSTVYEAKRARLAASVEPMLASYESGSPQPDSWWDAVCACGRESFANMPDLGSAWERVKAADGARVRSDRKAEAAEKTEMIDWIVLYGSAPLRRALARSGGWRAEDTLRNSYLNERIALERPGWRLVARVCGRIEGPVADPGPREIAALEEARRSDPAANLYWWTVADDAADHKVGCRHGRDGQSWAGDETDRSVLVSVHRGRLIVSDVEFPVHAVVVQEPLL